MCRREFHKYKSFSSCRLHSSVFFIYWRDGISTSLRTWWGDEILWLIHKFINWHLFAKELPNIFKAKFHIINVIFALPCHSALPSVPNSYFGILLKVVTLISQTYYMDLSKSINRSFKLLHWFVKINFLVDN